MKKSVLFSAFTFLSYMGAYGCGVWALIEFILLIARLKNFNWWSIYSLIICALVCIIMFFMTAISVIMAKQEQKHNPEIKKTSRFQQRLEQMEKERQTNKANK